MPAWPRMPVSRRPKRSRGLPDDPSLTHLREALLAQVQAGSPVTYRDLAARMGLHPPQSIRRLALLLEALMDEDYAAGAPFLAAICVSRLAHGLPQRGFFEKAAALGRFSGDPDGPEARRFHRRELAHLRASEQPGHRDCSQRDCT